jgi:hypothetical protein
MHVTILVVKDKEDLTAYLKCTNIYATGAIYHTFSDIAGTRIKRATSSYPSDCSAGAVNRTRSDM